VTGHNETQASTAAADIVVIGAGPAGMAAATLAAGRGAQVVLLDEQAAPGGQIYRDIEKVARLRPADMELLGEDYKAGAGLVAATRAANIRHITGATVWCVENDPVCVYFSVAGQARKIRARSIIIATGAMERGVPLPGWTLPGVMGAGAAQVLLKSCGMVPDAPVVLAGSGPLLLLVADQLARAGCDIAAVVETTRRRDYLRAAPCVPRALRAVEYLLKGVKLRKSLRQRKIPLYSGATELCAEGAERFTALRFHAGGREREVSAGLCLLHEGVVPNVQITRQLGVDHEWYDRQDYWRPVLSPWGETSAPGIFVAGDGAGIGGAVVAAASGRICALGALAHIRLMSAEERDRAATEPQAIRRRHASVRPLLDTLFAPPRYAFDSPRPDTLVCRCAEVTMADIRRAVSAGCHTPDRVKASIRCGMGPCQGRMCGLSVSNIVARETGRPVADTGYYNIRSPIKPLALAELASLCDDPSSLDTL
jgi:thioredoxin reductase/bacterioferritin-associated ferredoxin